MLPNTVAATEPVQSYVQPAEAVVGAFVPILSAAQVTEATRGRQTFNDSDKDNYFEG